MNSLTVVAEHQLQKFSRDFLNRLKWELELNCQWSQELKHRNIMVDGPIARIRKTKSGCALVLADVKLDPSVSQRYEWTVAVKNTYHFYLGACL